MSSIGRLLMGQEQTPATVQNTTPQALQNLAPGLADALQQMMRNPQQYQGRYAAPVTQGEQQALQGVNQTAGQVGTGTAGQGALQQQANGAMNPFAGLTGLEQFGIGNIAQQAFMPSQGVNQASQFLGQQINGQMNPYAGAAGLGDGEQQGLSAIQQSAFGANPLTNNTNAQLQQLISGQQNPYAQQLMDATTRQITDQFTQDALKQRGLFTGSGQQIQGMGSSPFAQASAQLSGNVANAIGGAQAQLGSNLFAQQQQGQLQALGMAQQQPGLQLQNQIAGTQALGLPREVQQLGLNNQANAYGQMQQNQFNAAGLTNQFSGDALQRSIAGLSAAGTGQDRQATAYENTANRQLQAGSQLGTQQLAQQQAQLQAQLQNLQSQGLPRLVEQQGIDAGLAQYNTQQQQLQQLLQLMGGLSGPNNAVLPGMQGTQGLIQSGVNSFMGGLGSGMSDRRTKKDIQLAGTTPNGTKVYRFRYHFDEIDAPLRLGVMADEVEHIPGAVVRNEIGIGFVNYGKVMAHG